MRTSIVFVVTSMLVSAAPLVHAATGDSDSPLTIAPTVASGTSDVPTMTAAPSAGSALGEYKTISCSSNSAFSINSCDQCFDGGSVKVGDKLTGLFDNWTNSSPLTLSAYKDEQKTPNMVRFGNTTWTTTPASEANIWKYSSDIVWVTPTGETKSQFLLLGGQKVKFLEADIGAGYTLTKTDKKAGDLVGMLRFPVVSHTIDASANESAANTHYECVAYKLAASATPEPTTPTPAEVTQTKTGPETLLLIAAAFFIAFGMMFTLRRRV
ncbi:MAG: hypothetical protein PHY14_01940 [Candidatus Gracilibacteria bacterium]|nr:hypothetical protein [Candidatus Gracilibacteria bacterium]